LSRPASALEASVIERLGAISRAPALTLARRRQQMARQSEGKGPRSMPPWHASSARKTDATQLPRECFDAATASARASCCPARLSVLGTRGAAARACGAPAAGRAAAQLGVLVGNASGPDREPVLACAVAPRWFGGVMALAVTIDRRSGKVSDWPGRGIGLHPLPSVRPSNARKFLENNDATSFCEPGGWTGPMGRPDPWAPE